MKKIFTLNTSDLSLLVTLVAIFISSCTTRVEKEATDQTELETTKIVKELPVVTIATLDVPATEEGYFDLIVETSACLGENLWIGGKLESNTGATPGETEFEITQFTATGINSNLSYTLENKKGTLKAVSDEPGIIHLQLQEGLLQLQPAINSSQIAVAYHTDGKASDYQSGYWSCK